MTQTPSQMARLAATAAAPPPDLTLSEWADQERILAEGTTPEPGRWRTARSPHLREIMDAISDPRIEIVVIMSSAQVGKSEVLLNAIGYHVHYRPCPILIVQPTLEMARDFSRDRLAPMLEATPALAGRIAPNRARDAGNTILHKQFGGGHITLAGSNSAASLASRPIQLLLCDDVDRFAQTAGDEGDPVDLAIKRTSTFWNRTIVLASTPTVRGASRIEKEYETTDQREIEVPCPRCGSWFVVTWERIHWKTDKDGNHFPETAHVKCPKCAARIEEGHRPGLQMVMKWAPTAEASKPRAVGFHMSELLSPWRRWSQTVEDFLHSKRDTESLKVWTNTAMGELWEERGEKADALGLYARRERYPAPVPAGALILTVGVDGQDDRLELEIVGWGPGETSWSIDYLILMGDPAKAKVWNDLDEVLLETFAHETGHRLPIAAVCIDSGGHHTQQVYNFVKPRQVRNIYAIRGGKGLNRPVVSSPSRRRRGRGRRDVELYTIGTDETKAILLSRLKIVERDVPGYCHFPLRPAYDEEYFRQLTAHKRSPKKIRGITIWTWTQTRPRDEAADCRRYAHAALYLARPRWRTLAARLAGPAPEEDETPPEPRRRRRKSRTEIPSWRW